MLLRLGVSHNQIGAELGGSVAHASVGVVEPSESQI